MADTVKAPKLVDMKLSQSARRAMVEPMETDKGPQYPWGLVLRLETDQLKKLGIKKLPSPGTEFHIRAVGKVDSIHESQAMGNRGDRSMSLQIVYLGVSEEAEPYDKVESADEESAE